MLDSVGSLPVETAQAEVQSWLAARTPETAAEELCAVLPGAPRERVMGAFLAFDLLGPSARTAVEQLQQDVNAGPIARAWLVQHGYLDIDAADPEGDAIDSMLAILATLTDIGPDAVVTAMEQLGEPAAQTEFLGQAWRSPVPETTAILEALGDLHPDKRVRKAARKAVFKRRSAGH